MRDFLRRTLILLLLAIIPVVLTGCGDEDFSYEAVDPGQMQAPTVERTSAEYRKKYSTLERYDETVTIDVAAIDYPLEAGVKENLSPFNQSFNQIALDVLNIKLNYVVVTKTNNYESSLDLHIAENGLPDMFYVTNPAVFTEYVEDGMLADLSDVFWYLNDELQENYLEHFPELLPTVMREGKIYSLPTITNQYTAAQRLYIRQDWLDIVGMEAPTTMEEMYAVGKAFADNKAKIAAATGVDAKKLVPFAITKDLTWSGTYSVEGFLNCYGTSMNAYFEGDDGELYFSNTSPEMKAALTMLRDMYSANILDKGFTNRTTDQIQASIKSGYVGMAFGEWWMPKDSLDVCHERVPSSEWTWVNLPAPAGQESKPVVKQVNVSGYNIVSKDCKNPEALARLINLFYDIYYSDDAQEKYGDSVLPSNGFYYQFVPVKLWDGIASIREYKRVQEVFDNLYNANFDPALYIDAATYATEGVVQKVPASTTTKDDVVIDIIDGVSYIINRDVMNAINANETWRTEFNKLHKREKTLHFADGYQYFVAYKNGKDLSEMSKAERAGWGIYHEMIDPEGGYAYVVDLTEKRVEAKYDRFYGASLSAMIKKLPYITSETGTFFSQIIVGEKDIDEFDSYYVNEVVNDNGGPQIIKQVNEWYKANTVDLEYIYALVK